MSQENHSIAALKLERNNTSQWLVGSSTLDNGKDRQCYTRNHTKPA